MRLKPLYGVYRRTERGYVLAYKSRRYISRVELGPGYKCLLVPHNQMNNLPSGYENPMTGKKASVKKCAVD